MMYKLLNYELGCNVSKEWEWEWKDKCANVIH